MVPQREPSPSAALLNHLAIAGPVYHLSKSPRGLVLFVVVVVVVVIVSRPPPRRPPPFIRSHPPPELLVRFLVLVERYARPEPGVHPPGPRVGIGSRHGVHDWGMRAAMASVRSGIVAAVITVPWDGRG